MVGRALRGPKFGGTEQAYIVSFIDNWQHSINWAEYEQIEETPTADDPSPKVGERLPMQLISIDLVRRLVRQMDSGVNINIDSFLTLMPIGWYRVELETLMEGSENTEIVQRLVMVFENEKESYQRFIEHLKKADIEEFVEADVCFKTQQQRIKDWQKQFFANIDEHIGGDLLANLFHITRHMAQNYREPPDWFDFEQRQEHDLDAVAQKFLGVAMSDLEKDEKLYEEYNREDRYWKIIYYSYELFWSQYNACVAWLLATRRRGANPEVHRPTFTPNPAPPSEPPDEIKAQVKKRDGFRCLCCGEARKSLLVVDHINPKYHGGEHSLKNLQTLCRICNQLKGLETIDFRIHQTLLTAPQAKFPDLELPESCYINGINQWQQFFRRNVNLFYGCDAVKTVEVGQQNYCYRWQIFLYAGNDPRWLVSHLKNLFTKIRQVRKKAGFSSPESILINAPGFDLVAPITG